MNESLKGDKSHQSLALGWRWVRLREVSDIIMGQSPPGNTYTDKPVGMPFFQGKADFSEYFPKFRVYCTLPIKTANEGDILISIRAPVGPVNMVNFENGKYPFVRVQDLGRYARISNLKDIKDYINDIAIKELNLVKAEKGTILFPKSGAAILTNNRAILGINAFIVSHLAALKPKYNKVENFYVYYWLCFIDMNKYMENPGYPSLKLSTISKISIPLPSLEVQHLIAFELKEKISEAEKLRIILKKQLDAINALPQAILRKAFRGEL